MGLRFVAVVIISGAALGCVPPQPTTTPLVVRPVATPIPFPTASFSVSFAPTPTVPALTGAWEAWTVGAVTIQLPVKFAELFPGRSSDLPSDSWGDNGLMGTTIALNARLATEPIDGTIQKLIYPSEANLWRAAKWLISDLDTAAGPTKYVRPQGWTNSSEFYLLFDVENTRYLLSLVDYSRSVPESLFMQVVGSLSLQ
jgi:hypothetical protein